MFKNLAHLATALILAAVPVSMARAQLMDQLKSAGSGLLGGAVGGGIPSVTQASPGNLAGVLQYCVQNNYMSSGSVSSVKDSLLSKVTGGGSNSSFQAGSGGLLETGNGQNFSLGGGGLKQEIVQQVCNQVLAHAKSLL
jgi:hypothetical protein